MTLLRYVHFIILFEAASFIAPGTGLAAVSVWVADPLRKVLPYDAPVSSAAVQLYCAKNEFESFQLVVSGAADDINDIRVTAGDLTGPATLASGNYRLFREHYLYIRQASDTQSIGTYGGSPVFVPDALVPYDRRVPPTYDPRSPSTAVLDPAGTHNKVFWVDLFVPPSAQAGDYRGTVTVSVGGAAYPVAVHLHVWNFTLPSNNSYKLSFTFSGWTAAQGHDPGSGSKVSLSEEYARVALENRISFSASEIVIPGYTYHDGGTPYDGTPASLRDDSITVDWTAFDAVVGPMLDGTLTPYGRGFDTASICIPYDISRTGRSIYDAAPLAPDEEMKLVLYWREFAKHFRQKGWFDKLYFDNLDEPDPSRYPDVLYLSRLLFYADPDIPVMVTEPYTSALDTAVTLDPNDPKFNTAPDFYRNTFDPLRNVYSKPGVDIWCPVNRDYDYTPGTGDFTANPQVYRAQQAKGRRVWWYVSCVSWDCQTGDIDARYDFDIATLAIDATPVYVRHMPWLARRYGIEGFLYWNTVAAYPRTATADPWIDQFDVAAGNGGNGDGTLFYPGRPATIGGTTDIAVPSIRLKLLRDGLEDYEYLKLLDMTGQADYVNASLAPVAATTRNWAHDGGEYLDLRRQFGNRLGALAPSSATAGAAGGLAAPTGLNVASATAHSITLTWVGSAGATHYVLERRTAGGPFSPVITLPSTTMTYTDTGLDQGTSYTYRIKAAGDASSSAYSGEKTVMTPAGPGTVLYGNVLDRVPPGGALVLGSSQRKGVIDPGKGDTAQIYFKGSRQGEYRCRIFTLTGELVWQSTQQDVRESMFEWSPGGSASGVYIAHISGPGMNVQRKIAVIK